MGKNLNFCLQYNRNQLNKNLLQFYRNIKLKAHFKDNETKDFYLKTSSWTPSITHPNVSTFVDSVNKDIENTKPGKQPQDNISNGERIDFMLNAECWNFMLTVFTVKVTKKSP